MKTLVVLALLSAFGAITYGAPQYGDRPVPHISLWERILLKTISKSNPGLFKGKSVDEIFRAEPTPNAYPVHIYVDVFFVEFRQLLTQAIKIPKDANLLEIDWSEDYEFCLWGSCSEFTLSQRSANSKMIGTQTTKSTTEVSPTSFKNTFFVPYFKWTSPNWQFNYTTDTSVSSAHGYHIEAENFTFEVSADYEYVDHIGIQLRNFSTGFDVANFTTRLDAIYHWEDGSLVQKDGPYVEDLTEYLIDNWEWANDKYEKNLLMEINCLLSNGMSDPKACFLDEQENYNAYYRFLSIQLMQTIGMGALLS